MRLNYSTCRLTALLLTSIVLMSFSGFARADKRLTLLTEMTMDSVKRSLRSCYLSMREADTLYRGDEIAKYQSKLHEISRCIENAPAGVKSEVERSRSSLARKPNALAAFKEFILTYRQLLARLGSPSTTLREADTYEAILDGKAAKVLAEIEW